MSQRECIGGPFDGDTVDLSRRMFVVAYSPDRKQYVSLEVDDEAEAWMGALEGRYVKYPQDRRPDALRWLPYD